MRANLTAILQTVFIGVVASLGGSKVSLLYKNDEGIWVSGLQIGLCEFLP